MSQGDGDFDSQDKTPFSRHGKHGDVLFASWGSGGVTRGRGSHHPPWVASPGRDTGTGVVSPCPPDQACRARGLSP